MRNPRPYPSISRRRLLGTTAAGIAATSLGACATSGKDVETEEVTLTDDPENPFGVDPSAPLDVVIFDGGYGDEYAREHQALYRQAFPDARIEHLATQDIAPTQQPRFADSSPTDVLQNAGAQQLPMDSLVGDGELADLGPLLEAPSYDDPDVPVRDTLRDGTIAPGTYNGTFYALLYAYSIWGVWYDHNLFTQKGWTPPTTWEEMLDLCEDIKADGMAPWTYPGVHPQYLFDMFMMLAGRHSGVEAIKAIDNLEPDAWRHPSVEMAAEEMYKLWEAGYILEGTPGLDHIQSQTAHNEHQAAFIPNGSWLPNEQRAVAPEGFEYGVMGVPYLEGSVQPGLISAGGNDPFVVPEKAANKAGAFEYLRIMLSEKGAQVFADVVSSPTTVRGVSVDSLAVQMTDELVADPENIFQPQLQAWYSKMEEAVKPGLADIMSGEMKPDEFIDEMQATADEQLAEVEGTDQHFTHE